MPVWLTKVSLFYSSTEDRLCLAGDAGEDAPVTLWLTLRLSRLLVDSLTKFIELASPVPHGANRDMVLSFQQSAAEMRNEPSDPVKPSNDAPPALVTLVNIEQRDDSLAMLFPLPNERTAGVVFSVQQARQWLGILLQQFRAADWPLDGWPDWMTATPADSTTPEQRARLH